MKASSVPACAEIKEAAEALENSVVVQFEDE
jgi:hypothetical protein